MNQHEPISVERRTVRVTLTAKHTIPQKAAHPAMLSLFGDPRRERHPLNEDGHANPEDYPEEMNTAVQDMLDRDAGLSEREIYDAGVYEDEEDADPEPGSIEAQLEELFHRLQELADQGADYPGTEDEEEDDAYVFRTLGVMEQKRYADGAETIEISYAEDDSMDDTGTLIAYNPSKPNAVTIYHTGAVMSTLVCERGKRHISAYQTPIMPFEVAVYTKKCVGAFDFERGGSMELDYLVEVRGADMQRTEMTIDAIAL